MVTKPQAAGSAGCARIDFPQAAGSAGCARFPSGKQPARRDERGHPRYPGVAPALALEHPFERQEGEPVLAGGAAQLLELESLRLQGAQQLEPGAPGPIALRSLQQALRLEVDRHGQIVTGAYPVAPSAPARTLLT
jgi:hypothetical protein